MTSFRIILICLRSYVYIYTLSDCAEPESCYEIPSNGQAFGATPSNEQVYDVISSNEDEAKSSEKKGLEKLMFY